MKRVIVAMFVVVLGASLGTHMHGMVREHDAALRTPGQYATNIHNEKVERCLHSSNPDACALYFGLAI